MGAQLATPDRLKTFQPQAFKSVGQALSDGTKLEDGEFVAIASVFGNIDSYGERLVKGAFADTLAEWAASGDPIPVIWQHAWGNPEAHIGEVLSIEETDEGLVYKGRLDLDEPFAAKVYKLMKARRITQQSFGFDVLDAREITEEGKSIFEITKVKLYEVGPCLVGVNQSTDLLDIKSTRAAALAAAEQPTSQTPPAASAPSEEPASAPAEAPASKGLSPASVRLLADINELDLEDHLS